MRKKQYKSNTTGAAAFLYQELDQCSRHYHRKDLNLYGNLYLYQISVAVAILSQEAKYR